MACTVNTLFDNTLFEQITSSHPCYAFVQDVLVVVEVRLAECQLAQLLSQQQMQHGLGA